MWSWVFQSSLRTLQSRGHVSAYIEIPSINVTHHSKPHINNRTLQGKSQLMQLSSYARYQNPNEILLIKAISFVTTSSSLTQTLSI